MLLSLIVAAVCEAFADSLPVVDPPRILVLYIADETFDSFTENLVVRSAGVSAAASVVLEKNEANVMIRDARILLLQIVSQRSQTFHVLVEL